MVQAMAEFASGTQGSVVTTSAASSLAGGIAATPGSPAAASSAGAIASLLGQFDASGNSVARPAQTAGSLQVATLSSGQQSNPLSSLPTNGILTTTGGK
jgi:hypothetical protein